MALFYGTVIPILYPLCAFGIFETYFRETLLLTYHYKQPPVFDWKVTEISIQITQVLAITCLPFIFFQLGNRQIFENVSYEMKHMDDRRPSGHDPIQAVSTVIYDGVTYNAAPIVVFGLILVGYLLMKAVESKVGEYCEA